MSLTWIPGWSFTALWATPDAADKLDDILKEYTDRFGKPPPEVHNLLYAVRIKGLAAKAGIESISTEEGYIILRRFQGMPFDAQKVYPVPHRRRHHRPHADKD